MDEYDTLPFSPLITMPKLARALDPTTMRDAFDRTLVWSLYLSAVGLQRTEINLYHLFAEIR